MTAKANGLPPRMHPKDGGYYYVRKNKWTHLGGDRESALRLYRRIEHGLSISESAAPSWCSMDSYFGDVYRRSRKNAKLRGLTFDLPKDDFVKIVARANGACEVTGITFELSIKGNCEKRPFAPSLDRVDSSHGYSVGNCRLVCGIVNAAIGAWGDDIFWRMVTASRRKLRG
jgi:hypothetical protein